MSWAAMLLSVSVYSWYLVFAHLTHTTYPGLWTGLIGLFILALIPTWLGLTLNRCLLTSGPTVFKIVLFNLILWLLLVGLTVPGSIMVTDYLFWNPPYPLRWTAYIFPACWQLLAWLFGTYFVFTTANFSAIDRPANIKTVEISLILMIPAVFILTLMGFPGPLLIMLIAGWFLPLTLTLAVEGTGFTEASVIRYDLVIFHAVVPPLAAIIIFAAAFLGEIRSLMQTAREALFALLNFLLLLLMKLFPPDAQPYELLPGMAPPPMPAGETEKYMEPGAWFLWVLMILVLLISIPTLLALFKLLKTRLGPVPRLPKRRYRPLKALQQVWRWLVALVLSLLKLSLGLFIPIKILAGRLQRKLQIMLRRWLPAKTPGQKIFRSYEAFLRLGRRSGYPRKASETPLEYVRRLQDSTETAKQPFPGAEINRLTGLFIEAVYSNKPMSWQQAADSEMLIKKIVGQLKN